MTRPASLERLSYLIILLIAVVLRFGTLPQLPPGVAHDEVAEVLIARRILQGHHALFFQEAYGQEPLFLYLVAGAFVLFGESLLALRFVTASVGLLTVAAGTRLARQLFGRRVALVTAMGLGVMLWPVFWSRVGLRGMTLPLLMSLGCEALWGALHANSPREQYMGALRAGVYLGGCAYTYLAARGLPLLFGAWLVYLALFDRAWLRRVGRVFVLALGLAVIVTLPLSVYVLRNPELQYRVQEVNAPLTRLLEGDPRPVLENIPRVLGMFTVRGDFTARNNAPDRPVFPDIVWAMLFYVGVGVALYRIRDARYGFILLWLGVMLSPTLVTTEAPNFVRALGALPVVMLLPGVGFDRLVSWGGQRWRGAVPVCYTVLGMAWAVNVALTVRDYGRWSTTYETQFVWQRDLVAVARALDAAPELVDVTVAGLSNTSMDAPSLALLMRRDDARVRWVDTGSPLGAAGAVILPEQGGWLMVPNVVPLNQTLARWLTEWAGPSEQSARYQMWRIAPEAQRQSAWQDTIRRGTLPPTTFENGVSLLAVHLLPTSLSLEQGARAVEFLTVWRSTGLLTSSPKIFVHVFDANGKLLTQHDGLDSPARFWQLGDVIVQVHRIEMPETAEVGEYEVRVGLYDHETLARYKTLAGQPFVVGGTFTITDGP